MEEDVLSLSLGRDLVEMSKNNFVSGQVFLELDDHSSSKSSDSCGNSYQLWNT